MLFIIKQAHVIGRFEKLPSVWALILGIVASKLVFKQLISVIVESLGDFTSVKHRFIAV